MYQRNRNLFSFLAVLITAGLITGIGGLFLVLVDQLGSAPQLVSGGVSVSDVDSTPLTPTEPVSKTLGTHDAIVLSVSAANDAPLIASGSYDNTAQLWDRNSQQAIPLPHNGRVNALTFAEKNDLLVTGSSAGEIAVWFTPSGQLSDTVQTQSGPIMSVAVNAKDKRVVAGSAQGGLTLWQITAGSNLQRLTTLSAAGSPINAVAFHPVDDNIVVSGDQNGLIRVWNMTRNKTSLTLDGGPDEIVSMAVSPDGQYVASGSDDKTIRVWNLTTGALLQTLTDHDLLVSAVAFSPDGRLLVSSSYDESVKVWAWTQGLALCTLKGHSGFVNSVAVTDGGNTLVSGGYDGTIRLWDLTATENQDCLSL